ncbi:HupE/UreJ family protein [Ruegeria atlantica]|uniref:HupE/UreJ family protein n=1 Tax=Ruegeria atlantica TaxID=81569 RepID=UPI0026705230|nr:HupE/UreJ family protein [Ruegeria atlantica]
MSEQYPWVVCFCFGLLHGLGFAGALADIRVPTDDIIAALLAFDIGVEAGQLLFIVALSALILVWRHVLPTLFQRAGTIATPVTKCAIGCASTY